MNEQELREAIAKEIENLHADKSWTYDVDIALIIARAAEVARGKNGSHTIS